jgi:hypothetical protein
MDWRFFFASCHSLVGQGVHPPSLAPRRSLFFDAKGPARTGTFSYVVLVGPLGGKMAIIALWFLNLLSL